VAAGGLDGVAAIKQLAALDLADARIERDQPAALDENAFHESTSVAVIVGNDTWSAARNKRQPSRAAKIRIGGQRRPARSYGLGGITVGADQSFGRISTNKTLSGCCVLFCAVCAMFPV